MGNFSWKKPVYLVYLSYKFRQLSYIMSLPKKVPTSKGHTKAAQAKPVPYSTMHHFDQLFISFLNEGETGYQKAEKQPLMDILNDNLKMVDLIRKGISYAVFAAIQKVLPLTVTDWEEILNLNMRSVMRYKAQGKSFKPIQSEKILQIVHIYALGLEVFGDKNKLNNWLIASSFALGSRKPVDLLKDSYGQQLLINELTRISYGIFV